MRHRLGEHARDQRGDLTGPNPVDRGKKGSKIHLITERTGLPLSIGISAANTHDSQGLEPLVRGIPPIRFPARAPPPAVRQAAWRQGLRLRPPAEMAPLTKHHPAPRPPARRVSQKLGRHRWTVERTVAWLSGCRRLHRRYERKPEHFLAFAVSRPP
ncbi:transposase [Streptomyces sp. NPDC056411]|uniref:transposase n=1 Tax=Streptomyces sp. NPDC056411 TaxID=3345813 RepID=UPI0035D953F6